MRTRRLVLAAASFAVLLCASGSPAATEASWRDDDAATGTFAAATLPAPTLNGQCTYNPALAGLGAYVRIYWKLPAGYALADAEMLASTSGLGSVLAPLTGFSFTGTTTGSAADGYVTDVPTNLLGGLLGLGSELELAIVVERYGWTSREAAVATNAGFILGIGGTCRNLTPGG
ncbi:hypothetical protein [Arthrobacter sp. C152]